MLSSSLNSMAHYFVENPRFDTSEFGYGDHFGATNFGPAQVCESCGSFLTMLRWISPHRMKVSRRTLGDFVFGTFVNFIVSSRFRALYQQEQLTGIQAFHPVEAYFRSSRLAESYFYPEIIMSDARIDLELSGFEFNNGQSECEACQKNGRIIRKWDGVYFEQPDKIDFDVFNTKVLGETPVVSERFKEVVQGHRLSNISLIISSKYSTTWSD